MDKESSRFPARSAAAVALALTLSLHACGGGGGADSGSGSPPPAGPPINYTVSTFAGPGPDFTGNPPQQGIDGTGSAAYFGSIHSLAFDALGNMLITDTAYAQLRKANPAGVVSTVTPSQSISSPYRVVPAADGTLFVIDHTGNVIRRVSPTGEISVFAGSGVNGFANGSGIAARFSRPRDMVMDRAGNLFVSESSYAIRKITPSGVVSTFVGDAVFGGAIDGVGTDARIGTDVALAIDRNDNIYFSQVAGDANIIRKVTPTGVVSTLPTFPTGTDSNGVRLALEGAASALAVDSAGNLFIIDKLSLIRRISSTGNVSEVAGQIVLGAQDGAGPRATFGNPTGLAIDARGDIYVADGRRIRLIRAL